MRLNTAIILTWLRVALIPVVVGVFFLPSSWLTLHDRGCISMVFFVLASVTDYIDGYIARKYNQTTAFGAFLDPVADKLMVASALIVLVHLDRVHAIWAVIIIGREIAITALREWMAIIGASASVAVSSIGKFKTAAQMIAIPMLLYHDSLLDAIDTRVCGNVLLIIAAILTMWSMFYYLRRALPMIKEQEDKNRS